MDELSDHEERWEELRKESGGTIYASFPLVKLWLETYQRFSSPRIILVEDQGDLVGIAPLAVSSYSFSGIPMKTLTLVGEFGDMVRLSTIAPMALPKVKGVEECVLREVRKEDWSLFTAINMEGSELVRSFIDGVREDWYSVDFPPGRLLTLDLPESGEISKAFEKKARKNLNYRKNLLAREGHNFALRLVGQDQVDRAVDDFVRMHVDRWETKGGSLFLREENVEFLSRTSKEMYERGFGRIYELPIDGEIAAQEFEFIESGTAYGFKISMNDAFSRYSPGWLLMDGLYTDLRDRGIYKSNMGIGGHAYKYELGGEETPLIGIRATRGFASLLTRLARSSAMQFIDDRLNLSKKAFKAGQVG